MNSEIIFKAIVIVFIIAQILINISLKGSVNRAKMMKRKQGPPGAMGPMGMKGEKGDPGECKCNCIEAHPGDMHGYSNANIVIPKDSDQK